MPNLLDCAILNIAHVQGVFVSLAVKRDKSTSMLLTYLGQTIILDNADMARELAESIRIATTYWDSDEFMAHLEQTNWEKG